MRAKCPKCKAVFEVNFGFSPIHIGPVRWTKCPACGKSSMMNNFVNDPITWPPEEAERKEEPMSEGELKEKRIEDSKYEEQDETQS